MLISKVFSILINSFQKLPLISSYKTAAALKSAIKAVKYEAGRTFTAEAMKEALQTFLKDTRKDNDTAKVRICEEMIDLLTRQSGSE